MNEYFLKVVSTEESLHHTIDFEIYKNETLFWRVRKFYGRIIYKIVDESESMIVIRKRWLLYPYLDVIKNDEKIYSFINGTCKIKGIKLQKDRRDFIREGQRIICSIDIQSRGWNTDERILLRWKHDEEEIEEIIAIYALLPSNA
ncbi:hypothetical protein P886_3446 [Alteromonadaceae bacterium 2753L.S.0a.02]|nr:hypothetical protein P886_3446 [Alteromonadaceae bacterium 2753L.S.0a.02]